MISELIERFRGRLPGDGGKIRKTLRCIGSLGMFRRREREARDRECELTDLLLNRWHFTAGMSGELRVCAIGTSLGHDEFHTVLSQILSLKDGTQFRRIVFDLAQVRAFDPPWTAMFALLIHFARATTAMCVVAGLRDQPAKAATLYRNNRELMAILETAAV